MYCLTEKLLRYFFTKPLQGSLLGKFRDVIMGATYIYTLKKIATIMGQERAGNHSATAILGFANEVGKSC